MPANFQDRIAASLLQVFNARTGNNVLAAEMVRDIATTTDGKVRLTVLLAPEDDATIVRAVRQAVEKVAGVTSVQVDVKDASQVPSQTPSQAPSQAPSRGATPRGAQASSPQQQSGGRALPVMDQRPATPKQVPAPTPVAYPALGRIVAISSGKGGVGKSTVATNLAVALAQGGARVGLMDADIYGPNVPRMMGVDRPLEVNQQQKIIPHEAFGVKLVSVGFIMDRDQPAIWRGPIIMKVVTQFLRDVLWGELDYFIVDMPPGTGDAQLSLVQATQVHGAVIVTTPQDVATGDALRGARMFQRVNVPVLGIVENMSYLECPHCGKPTAIFGSGGGERLANELQLPLLAQIPLEPRMVEGGDTGRPVVAAEPESTAAKALLGLAGSLRAALASHDPATV